MAKAKKAKHAGGRPPLPPGERLSTQLGVRLDASSTERLDKLVARLGGEASRPTVLRAASTFGLRALERDPAMLSFTDEVEQAERLLDKHWGVDPRSGVERIGDEWVAWVMRKPDYSVEAFEAGEGRSTVSVREALERLAEKVQPLKPLPWLEEQVPKARRKAKP